ncbi:type IV-A pilus assembly ATPase PilB [Pseudomonadota bacterium]
MNSTQLSGLAKRLVDDDFISMEDAQAATEKAVAESTSLVHHLVSNKIVGARDIAISASSEFGFPLFDLDTMDIEMAAVPLVDEKLIKKHSALPLTKRGNRLYVAISDPTNMQAIDEIKFATGINTDAILVEDDKLTAIIEKTLEAMDDTMDGLDDADLDDLDVTGGDEEPQGDVNEQDTEDAPIVRFVNKILLDAINKGASDIHFEPYEKSYRVRYRQDGMLHEVAAPPISLALKMSARIKVMSRLDISERRIPQDGRMKLKISKNRAIDFRVSTCPTLFGEKIVMRILDPESAKLGIDVLGYEPEQKKLYLDALALPYGMILVTGPTGSGKTVSLYTGVNILNTPERNISTAEDPAEINLEGVNQVNVNPKVGLTFSAALKAFLRQDPDVILVGEIRDIETGEIAIKAAQTGHLVLSTLHTNDAPQTLSRLINMGVAPFNIASAVSLIIAQRLGRRLCKHCKAEANIPKEAMLEEGFTEEQIGTFTPYKAAGCDQCTDGYKGRVGIYQVMPISEEMGRIIMSGGNAIDIADQAKKEGIPDLRESGLKKVVQGLTSLEEINRVVTE